LDWHNQKLGRPGGVDSPDNDEGVIACRTMYQYIEDHGYKTLCMPASWRPSRGTGYELDEIRALSGSHRMTIPAPLLTRLAECTDPLPRQLHPRTGAPLDRPTPMSEAEFRYRMLLDECGAAKLEEGMRAFIQETIKLEQVMTTKVREASLVKT
jgi:transaldolase